MKNSVKLHSFCFVILVIFLHSCKKEVVPTLTTATVTNITGTTATSGGTITDEGSGTVVERGICWSKGITPTIADIKTIEGGGAGTFISNMVNLDVATSYYVRAYAKNEAGTGYGMAMAFSTLGQAPSATTQSACCITYTGARLNGTVNANYISTTVTFEYGTTTTYGSSIATTPSPVTGNTTTSVIASIAGLNTGTTYHFRIKALNSLGTTYGDDMSFTIPIPPSTNGLVAYYPFNGNANDESGNNLNGTVYGATLTTDKSGTPNKAYYFNGSNNYIKILSNTLLNLPTYTIAVWINVERFSGSNAEAGEILAKGIYPNYNYNLAAGVNNTNTLGTGTTSNGNYADFQSTNTFNAKTWYLLAVTNDGSNLKMTVNTVSNGSISVGTIQTNNNDIYIGRYEGDTRWFYKGKIDDIRIYNRALTETEIQQIYNEL